MKIRTQFIITIFLFGLILILIVTSLVVTNQQVDRLFHQEEIARNIERTARELSYLSNDYLLHRENQQRARWQAKADSLSADLAKLNLTDPEHQVLVDQMKADQERLLTVFTDIAGSIESTALTGDTAVDMEFIQVSWSRMEVQNQGMIFDAYLLAQKLRDQEDRLKRTNEILIIVLAGIFGTYILTNYFFIYRPTLRSLSNLQAGTKIIGSGNLAFTIEDHRANEIGELSRAFNQMTTSLREITASKEDLEREITERKLVEEALSRSQARLRRLVEANIIGVLTRDAAGQVKDANQAFLNIIGYSMADIRADNLNINKLIPDEYQLLEKQEIQGVLAKGASKPYEKEYCRKDGQRVPVLVAYTQLEEPIDGASSAISTDMIGFVLDMTELRKAQADLAQNAEKLKRSNQELEQFASIASHDLQEPLRKIRSFGDRLVIMLGDQLEEEPREYLTRMKNATQRMQAMINDLLELSRVNTRGNPFTLVDLTAAAATVVSDLEPRILAAQGQVQLEPLPVIEADPVQMRQLLQNLISNAVKYHKPDHPPRVKISCRSDLSSSFCGERITLLVEDNGIGFSEEYLQTIFQPFQRLHGRSSKYEGTGIGLSICKKIVERHQGTITAQSQPGEGATFLVALPVKQNK